MGPVTTGLMSVIRGIEAFVIVVVIAFASQLTIAGQPVNLATPSGQAALSTALVSAILIALRHYTATNSPGTGGPLG